MDPLIDFLNRALQVLLELDPDGKEALGELEGKVLCLQFTLPSRTLYVELSNDGLSVKETCASQPDVTLTGSIMAFARLSGSGTASGALSDGQIIMEGDAETGQAFQKILSQIDLDWEAVMARYIGDMPARKAGNFFRELSGWASESVDLSRKNTAEYLTEEKRILVTGLAMERFSKDLDELRADVDRLEQRLVRIKRQLDSEP